MKKHTDTQQLTCVLLLSRWWRKPRLWWKMLRRKWTAWERKEKQTDMCLIWSPSTYSPERGKPGKRTGGRVLCSWDGLARLLVSWSGPVSRNGSPGYKLKIVMTYLTGLLLCCMLGCAGVGDVCHRNDGKVPWADCGFCICWGSDCFRSAKLERLIDANICFDGEESFFCKRELWFVYVYSLAKKASPCRRGQKVGGPALQM